MKPNVIRPGSTIGILGGGQLGRMMAVAARHMGYRIAVLDPAEHCPCAPVADEHIVAAYNDMEAAEKLSDISDVITYEFENVDLEVARLFEEKGKLPQGSFALEVTQNRAKEKEVAVESGLPVPSYRLVSSWEQFMEALETIGYPAVIKTVSGGYDGKGQVKIEQEGDLEEVRSFIKEDDIYIVEQWLTFDLEISQVFTRGQEGRIVPFPIAENIHKNHILHESRVPANIPKRMADKTLEAVELLAERVGVVGTFAVEMFVKDKKIFINEMAPRPHNSGHYTIEACNVSQFEQHVRAICGLPLLPVHSFGAAVMVNMLGEHRSILQERLEEYQGFHFHDYGKEEVRQNRKMGHLTFIGNDLEEIDKIIQQNHIHLW
ncbi:5-(carboxyamino)imidazole ribonucleotide synthase [Halobacillus karajensis]|uniref:N5-carboxyaminoimidazole ribonucleotide synthase n=1 Tax=Halobacillus karajensis TaxID=195088 RepID=A0A024P544_9BACI|nr:5-(carboxyamino)imidazole ribonucleotide synthase [Halobacillus karajensis]CDQ20627.1 N5-carboxyaminoimidazole ribonucleotide synthase [Halobacillus karajensis]CDQ23903.1 N5-carboxyaminoimidazole ribonucleotide synthase [Halobacillus karajensis]CDQ27381.1 N5-carboxyaminoimidazole ribonucleotide synthase [Halobacillus karajensis]